ncbi:hypothetical protein [Cryptosporangium minutisporangium]|uniref:Uncharacterized protein n=1 Tax=Cryptosporangium minutisporangium TaxID=113569 RepID=A0ABP6SPE6_9ACTN
MELPGELAFVSAIAKATESWRHAWVINSHGLALVADDDGSWWVGRGLQTARPMLGDLRMALPMLELSYVRVSQVLAEQLVPGQVGPPLGALVRIALGWPTDYWPGLALRWLEEGFSSEEVIDELVVLTQAKERSQPLRHQTLRVWKRRRS